MNLPYDGHAIRTCSGPEGHIDDNRKVESVRDKFPHDEERRRYEYGSQHYRGNNKSEKKVGVCGITGRFIGEHSTVSS
jgi:hypothetical protein